MRFCGIERSPGSSISVVAHVTKVPSGRSLKVVAVLPEGHVEPLVWLYEYQPGFAHPFLFRSPLRLPAGTTISGVSGGAQLYLLPGKRK